MAKNVRKKGAPRAARGSTNTEAEVLRLLAARSGGMEGAEATTVEGLVRELAAARRLEEASNLYLAQYLKKKRKAHETHPLITRAALRLVGANETSPSLAPLIEASLAPDRTLATLRLFMEGHFHGKDAGGQACNFVPLYLSGILPLLRKLDDVDETAGSNFLRFFEAVDGAPGDLRLHGFTLHYLQDVTAPHHAANIPGLLPRLRRPQEPDTHFDFEARADKLFQRAPKAFDAAAGVRLDEVRAKGFDLSTTTGRAALFDWTWAESLKNAGPGLHDPATWDARIGPALTLAIAVSARYLEHHASAVGVRA